MRNLSETWWRIDETMTKTTIGFNSLSNNNRNKNKSKQTYRIKQIEQPENVQLLQDEWKRCLFWAHDNTVWTIYTTVEGQKEGLWQTSQHQQLRIVLKFEWRNWYKSKLFQVNLLSFFLILLNDCHLMCIISICLFEMMKHMIDQMTFSFCCLPSLFFSQILK